MPYNNQNGGYPQGGYQQGEAPKQKKVKINQWEGEGILRPWSSNQDDPIQFKPSANGGGSIHAILVCSEFTGRTNENGQPQMSTTRVPVCVFTNKNITAAQLQSITAGMKVHVVGKLNEYTYEDKKNPGQKKTIFRVNAFVFDVLEMPMQQGGYAPQQYAQPQQPQYAQPQPGYAPQQTPPQYPAYPPQQAPAQQPATPPYYNRPQAPQQGGYPPQQAPAQPMDPNYQAFGPQAQPADPGYQDFSPRA